MRRFGWAVGAAAVVALVELAVFIAAVKLIGLAWTLLLVVAMSLLGGWLTGREGTRSWRRFRAAVAEGRPPGREVAHGLAGLVGALLLTLPGFVTGVAGALLLVPPVRWYARDRIERGAQRYISPAVAGDFFGPRRVRVRRGKPTRTGPAPADPTGPPYPDLTGPEPTGFDPTGPDPKRAGPAPRPGPPVAPPPVALEGEIVDDRPRP